DKPCGGAVREALELGDVEGRPAAKLLEHKRMRQLRRPLERTQRTLEPALPSVRERECLRLTPVLACSGGERAQALAFGRCVVERPGERREASPGSCALDLLARKEPDDLVPERPRLARAALVARRLTN